MKIKKIEKKGTRKVFKHKCGKILVGTVNKIECKAVYVRLETWITPEESLETSIKAIRRRFIKNMYSVSNLYFEGLKSTIIDYDYALTKQTDIRGRKSFLSIEITLLAKDIFDYDEDFIFNCEAFGDTLFSLLETLSDKFSMDVSKK